MKRRKMSRGKSKKLFRRTVDLTHRFNTTGGTVKRGGIRL